MSKVSEVSKVFKVSKVSIVSKVSKVSKLSSLSALSRVSRVSWVSSPECPECPGWVGVCKDNGRCYCAATSGASLRSTHRHKWFLSLQNHPHGPSLCKSFYPRIWQNRLPQAKPFKFFRPNKPIFSGARAATSARLKLHAIYIRIRILYHIYISIWSI